MVPIRHILVAVDFHAASLRALEYASRLARSVGAKLAVLHTYDLSTQVYPDNLVPPIPRAEIERAVGRDLTELVTGFQQRGIDAKWSIRQGPAANEILEAATELDADLIVLGTHGRRGVSRLVLGSVAEQIVRRASVPVMTIHEWHFEDRTEASRRLAPKLTPLRGELDLTIAITRGAVPIAIELGRIVETPVDTLLVEPIAGPRIAPIGAVCEDGSLIMDPMADQEGIDANTFKQATESARATVRERARWLADPNGPRSVAGKRVLIVSDALASPSLALVAARALLRKGATCVTLAVPVCASSIVVALPPAIDSTLCVESTRVESPLARVYRDDAGPSSLEAAEMLVRAAHRTAAASTTAG